MVDSRSKPLVIFEMANNHMGSVAHGLKILQTFSTMVRPHRDVFDFAFKLQYRHLDSFIHPNYQGRRDIKFVKRFEETRLGEPELLVLREGIRESGFIGVCTPFDEVSVDLAEAHGFDYVKIASCSFGDWPLMERIGRASLPIIASTAGSSLETMDRVVSFFDHRNRPLTLLHCVAEYPTQAVHLQLNQLALLKQRYPQHRIGFSTHEEPGNTRFVQMALAKGAQVLEKHVGIPTPQAPLNAYSADLEQTRAWLEAAREALDACGETDDRYVPDAAEAESLHSLRRGVFTLEFLEPGQKLDFSKVMLAMPTVPGQLTANDLSKYAEFYAQEPLSPLAPVLASQCRRLDHLERIYSIVRQVRALLDEGHTVVGTQAEVEISHHYGIDRFEEFGATIINIVNRAYCKKLIVLLPGQNHPEQYHQRKEETFHVLHGNLEVKLDGLPRTFHQGEIITVEPGVRHEFTTESGAIFEEISSTHFKADSFYTDPAINANPGRKTYVTYFFG
jgi:sialic acid synthase SpsE/quercetin dioxygenase-like cupin family protein